MKELADVCGIRSQPEVKINLRSNGAELMYEYHMQLPWSSDLFYKATVPEGTLKGEKYWTRNSTTELPATLVHTGDSSCYKQLLPQILNSMTVEDICMQIECKPNIGAGGVNVMFMYFIPKRKIIEFTKAKIGEFKSLRDRKAFGNGRELMYHTWQEEYDHYLNKNFSKYFASPYLPVPSYFYALDDEKIAKVKLDGVNVCAMLRLFYGFRCIMAHGNAERTLENENILKNFPSATYVVLLNI